MRKTILIQSLDFKWISSSGGGQLVVHSRKQIIGASKVNVLWIVADTFRRDHVGAYGNPTIRTPSLDALAARSVRFDGHYAAGFPTMPTRADHHTGRWTMSFMGWEPLPAGVTTLAEMLADHGLHTAASVDTPYYLRDGMNYDRGFQSFFMNRGQDTLWSLVPHPDYHHESQDVRAAWRYESDRNAPRTFMTAIQWLEHHYKEEFFSLHRHLGPPRTLGRSAPLHRAILAGIRWRGRAPSIRKLA